MNNGHNPERAQPGWPPVVVAGGYQTGVVLMRNLVRRGLTVCCVDWNPKQPAFRSVYGKTCLCPNPEEDPAGWVEFMLALAANMPGKPALICTADQFVTAIDANAGRLKDAFLFCRNSAATQALLATKERQYEIAGQSGMPIPRTQFVRSAEEAAAFAAGARFPCLLKPVHFLDWERFPQHHPLYCQKTAMVPSAEKVEGLYRLAAQASPNMVFQEIIEGPDTAKLVYLACYDGAGRRIAGCLLRELRTCPIHFGSASVVEPISDPETDQLCDRFLRAIDYVGLCEIELKRDSRDGCVRMIEANPRYSVTADAAPYAGLDLGWLHYLDLIGQPVAPVPASPRRFRHIVLERDFPALAACRKEKLLTWRELLSSYRPPLAFFDFDWRDWRLTASTIYQLARFVAGRLVRRPQRQLGTRPAAST